MKINKRRLLIYGIVAVMVARRIIVVPGRCFISPYEQIM
jgi:hypothetical protein